MAKYDWKQLEKEYILGDYKSVSAFLKDKGIKRNGSTQQAVKGWNEKKVQKEIKKSSKTIEKVIEKESEKEAEEIVQVKDVANKLLLKILNAYGELDKHIVTNKIKTKTVQYDYECNKPSKETTEEKEEKKSFISIIDRKGLKELTSALKDINDILNYKQNENENSQSLAEIIQKAYESKVGDNNANT